MILNILRDLAFSRNQPLKLEFRKIKYLRKLLDEIKKP